MELPHASDKEDGSPELQTLLERQVDAWLSGERLEVEALLAEYPSFRDDEKVFALVCNEIALREGVGETPSQEEYRARFPQFESRLRSRFFSSGEQSLLPQPAAPSRPVAPQPSAEPVETLPVAPALKPPSTRPTASKGKPEEAAEESLTGTVPTDAQNVPGYEILGELGRGGMGVVYKARQLSLNRVVALKMILGGGHATTDDLERFRLEADAVGRLKHPNIVQIFDIGERDGLPYFSLEFVEGGTLDRKLNRMAMTPTQAAETVELLARAMQTAHDKGIIHRDLKPGNILLTREGIPKIADFGLAKQLHSDSGRTQSGSAVGTPSFMSPEQAEGRLEDLGPATDVYSLGAILYCSLTGRPPFKGATAVETMAQVINEEPLAPSRLQRKVSRDLETICLKCLAKSPRKRYDSAAQLADDLRRYLNGEPIHARAMGRAEQLWRWCRRHPVPASLLLTVIVGSAFGMWYLSRLSQEVVRSSALESAAQQTEMLERLGDFYSAQVVKPSGVRATYNYRNEPGTIPVPATLTIDLGQYISDHSDRGVQVRLYSEHPFLNRVARNEGGTRDQFERDALASLQEDPDEPYYRFEQYQNRPVLRYATARKMQQSCVDCHNNPNNLQSPKKDWKVGDVRGVLEIIRPLAANEDKARAGLRGIFVLIGGFCAALLAFSSLVLILGRRARRGS